jgi:peptide/nickel transport system substrate-binding protein
MKKPRALRAPVLFTGMVLLASACGGSGNSGDSVTVITDKPWNAYNNATADGVNNYNSDINVATLLTPYTLDDKNNVVLNRDLMSSVQMTSENPETIVWRINPKAVWSDGQPVSCKDFYLFWLANSGAAKDFSTAGTTGYDRMRPPTCSDNGKTVTTSFTAPFGDYQSLFDLSTNSLMPAHVLEKAAGIPDITKITPTSDPLRLRAAADFWNKKWQGFNPAFDLSDGPYLISDYQQNQSVTLRRNPRWWGAVGGPSTITVKFANNLTTQAQAVENGEVQAQFSFQPDADGSSKLQNLKSQGVSYHADPGLSFEHLDLNFRNPLFQAPAVRKAFFQCVNRAEIVQKLIKPTEADAKPTSSLLFFPGERNVPDNYSDKATGNPQQAARTLEADGWLKGPDGIATKLGKRLSFSISHTDIPRRSQTVQLINQQCQKAGIDVQDRTDPNFLNGPASQGAYDVALFAWNQVPFKSSSIAAYSTGGGENYQRLSSPQADVAFQQAQAQTSREKALPFYYQADQAISDTYGTLPLFNTPDQSAHTDDWNGITFQHYNGLLWDPNRWTNGGG